MLYNRLDTDPSKGQSINNNFDWFLINHFCEPVDVNLDQVIDLAILIGDNE